MTALRAVPVFFVPSMVAPSLSFSPSSMKPEKVVVAWQQSAIPIEIRDVTPVTVEELALAHDRMYVERILSGAELNGFGNKDAAIASTLPYTSGSMRDAAFAALDNGAVAVSPTSGFHHARWDFASSYCTFNGLIVAAQCLLQSGKAGCVGIIDCDYHYGDGTSQIVGKMDLGRQVRHFTAGLNYLSASDADAFFARLPEVIRLMSGCDVILYQAGADPHINDPLGGFLTTGQLYERDLLVFRECRQRGIPVAWNLAGGYQQHDDGSTNWDALTEIHSNTLKACWEVYGAT